jgi:hypothetical protein
VEMVGDQRPCIADGLCILEDFSQSLQKVLPVGITSEYSPPFNASNHHVM